jgi:hypothetical protein
MGVRTPIRTGWILGLKAIVRKAFGPQSEAARRILDHTQRLRRPLANALLEPPQPWLNPDRSLMVVWSAKSASSLAFIWYLATVGLLDDYRASGMSSHEYRGKRLARSDVVQRGRSKLLDDYWIVHILRDPYLRAVSSYRHALATGYADKRIGPRSGGSLDRKEGFSFARYLDYLETIDLRGANVHHRLQLHRVERIKPPDTVINISRQDLLVELNRLEELRGMPSTDFGTFGPFLQTEEKRRAKVTPFDGKDMTETAFNVAAAQGHAAWPTYEQLLNAATRRRIERLYADDFAMFGAYI